MRNVYEDQLSTLSQSQLDLGLDFTIMEYFLLVYHKTPVKQYKTNNLKWVHNIHLFVLLNNIITLKIDQMRYTPFECI